MATHGGRYGQIERTPLIHHSSATRPEPEDFISPIAWTLRALLSFRQHSGQSSAVEDRQTGHWRRGPGKKRVSPAGKREASSPALKAGQRPRRLPEPSPFLKGSGTPSSPPVLTPNVAGTAQTLRLQRAASAYAAFCDDRRGLGKAPDQGPPMCAHASHIAHRCRKHPQITSEKEQQAQEQEPQPQDQGDGDANGPKPTGTP